jgi:hypothetical protein
MLHVLLAATVPSLSKLRNIWQQRQKQGNIIFYWHQSRTVPIFKCRLKLIILTLFVMILHVIVN